MMLLIGCSTTRTVYVPAQCVPLPAEVDAADTGVAASNCRLTYGQAVYWIDPLLAAIDEVNSRLADIRLAENGNSKEKK
ncbi:Rz1-like lysis system protein LysC [Pectobacterium versatile]|uniref:Rz1-like lysis system protein LysC n=1 Tax=Pectobacterium versatile TaxID=2488639 RepID=UPI003BFA68D9